MSITTHSRWGDPRRQAADANMRARMRQGGSFVDPVESVPWHAGPPQYSGGYGAQWQHGRSPEEVAALRARFETFLPQMAGGRAAGATRADRFFEGLLPEGATLAPGAGDGMQRSAQFGLPGGGSLSSSGYSSFQQTQRGYQPEFDSPDRQSYPVHRCLVAGTLVIRSSGALAPIEDIAVGDTVLGPDGAPRTVEAAWSEAVPEELVEIIWANGRRVLCTREHVWPTAGGDVPASALTPGTICLFVRKLQGDAGASCRVWSAEEISGYAPGEVCSYIRHVDDCFAYVPVAHVSVIPNQAQLRVYDLTVSGDHKYVLADGLVTHNSLANVYWRLFYKTDAVIGTGVDLYSELPWGNFELSGEGVDGEIRTAYESMCKLVNLRAILPYIIREYLVVGEACIHNYFDDALGTWSYVALHNPDQLEVIYSPFLRMDPIVRFKPDHRLQQVLSTSSEAMRSVRESMPPELLSALTSGQHVEMHWLNFTFLPRKMHPYDVRGTSVISRMWRALMLEDGIFSASIATARRHAGPIKVAKLGDPNTGWIPDPSHHARLLEMLAQAEMDPLAWITYHYGVTFELVGSTDRVLNINQHWELFERIKLIALGISKAFLHGEVTYASAQSGLTIFLRRLRAYRDMIESSWLYPKFFQPIAEINRWVKPTQAEAASASDKGPYIQTRRSHREVLEDGRYIVPKIEWDQQLDPSIETSQLQAVEALEALGIRFSKQYLSSLVGRDWESELRQRAREAETEESILKSSPALAKAMATAGGDGGGGGMGLPPPLPPSSMGFSDEAPPMDMGAPDMGGGGPAPEMEAPAPPPEASVQADAGTAERGPASRRPVIGDWDVAVVRDLVDMINGAEPEQDLWLEMREQNRRFDEALVRGDRARAWDELESELLDRGYPSQSVLTLRNALESENVL